MVNLLIVFTLGILVNLVSLVNLENPVFFDESGDPGDISDYDESRHFCKSGDSRLYGDSGDSSEFGDYDKHGKTGDVMNLVIFFNMMILVNLVIPKIC